MVLEDIEIATPSHNWVRAGIGHLLNETTQKAMISLADQVVVSATNFLTGVIIGRVCIKEEFGLYMLGFTIVFFVTDLQTSLISTPYMVHSPRLKGTAHAQYTGSTLIHQLALSALVLLALIIGGIVLSLGIGPQGLAPVIWVLVLVITFIMLRDNIRRMCYASLQIKTALFLDSWVAIIQTSGLIFLAYFGLLSASRAYWVVGFTCGIAGLGWLIPNRKTFSMNLNQAMSDFWKNWSFGKWVFASGLVYALITYLYPWILAAFHGTAVTGVWAACIGVVALCNPVLLGVQNFLGPKIVHSYAKGGSIAMRRFVFKAGVVFSALMILFCVALFILGGPLVAFVYGSKYAGNGLIVSILALNLLTLALTFSHSRALFVMERADVDFAVLFVSVIILLTLGLWLVKSFGPLGVACGLLAGNASTSIVRYILFRRLIRCVYL